MEAGEEEEWQTVSTTRKRKDREKVRGYNSKDSDMDNQQVMARKGEGR